MALRIKTNTIPEGLDAIKVKKKALEKVAVARMMEIVRSHVIPLTPVDTSRLVGSFEEISIDGINEIIQRDDKTVGLFGTKVYYSVFVEFGTSKSKGKFFLTHAVGASRSQALTAAANVMQQLT